MDENAILTLDSKSSAVTKFAEKYNSFVGKSPQGILYQKTWWLDAVAPHQYEILTVEEAGRIRAAWPIIWLDDARTRVGMPKLTQKLGILLEPLVGRYAEQLSEQHRLIAELIGKLPKNVSVDQKFHEAFTNWLPFYWEHFQQTTRYTYVIDDLSDVSAIWDRMRKCMRQTIKQARRANLQIRETDDIEFFYAVNRKSFDRQGLQMPYNLDLVERIDTASRLNAGRRILIAEDLSGRAHACDFVVYDRTCTISLLGGAETNLRSSGAKALLQWESIRFASTVSGRFDFEGSMIKPIEQYIRGFGARQIPFFRIFRLPKSDDRRLPLGLRRSASRALRSFFSVFRHGNRDSHAS